MRCILLLALIVVLLAGCSLPIGRDRATSGRTAATPAVDSQAGPSNGPLSEGTAGVRPFPRATSSPAPVVGGHVTELIPLYPHTLNPLFNENEAQERVTSLLFEGLMRIDPETRTPVPSLAEDVQVSADGLRYTFVLSPRITWHDGTPMTARDVAWTYGLLRDSQVEAPLRQYAERIKNVVADEPSTVTFTLAEPYSPFLARLATAPIIPRKPFAGHSGQRLRARLLNWKQPVGTGPFRFVATRPGQSIELAAYARYHGGEPMLDRYNFRVLRDPAAVQQALSGGEADLAWLTPALVPELGEQDFLSQTVIDTPTSTLLFFNLDPERGGALLDRRVRRALAHALDLESIATGMNQAVRPATGYQPPTSPAYRQTHTPLYAYDPARAKVLLSNAGWKDADGDGVRQKGGQTLTLTLAVNSVPKEFPMTLGLSYDPAVASIIAGWKAVGVRVKVVREGWEAFASRVFGAHDFEVALLSMTADADPDTSYTWATEAYTQGFNAGRYASERTDALLRRGVALHSIEERAQVYGEVGRQLGADVPAVPLGATRLVVVSSDRLAGPRSDYWSALQHTDAHRWFVRDGR
ncbi:MAG: peptide ABC transporter substrate-binding protein [Chloroflexota bacterium]|nr:peptide ABC transporter substrate-binding protein [Chloroflexota bacterium]